MSYLLRTEDDYRLCYDEPVFGYIKGPCGTHSTPEDYNEEFKAEKEISAHSRMDDHYFIINQWSDIVESDNGLPISAKIAEYLLQGHILDVDEYIELTPEVNFVGGK